MTNTNNPMRRILIEKIVLNIGCGTTTPIDHAKTLLECITERKVITIRTKKRSLFGVPRGKAIGCVVTLRDNINIILKRLLDSRGNKLKTRNFDKLGNFAFGIPEYIDIPGMNYDPKIGMLGLDVCVTLVRPGYRVKKKSLAKKVGKKHLITKDDAMTFMRENFNTTIE